MRVLGRFCLCKRFTPFSDLLSYDICTGSMCVVKKSTNKHICDKLEFVSATSATKGSCTSLKKTASAALYDAGKILSFSRT